MLKCKTVRNLNRGINQLIVTYGTSLTAEGAWVSQVERKFKNLYPGLVTLLNNGCSSKWSGWGVSHLEERVLKHRPDTVFIEFAINDAYLPYDTTIKQCRENLESMIEQILQMNRECEIILMTMNPPIGEHYKMRPEIEAYYQVYREVANQNHFLFIDHYWEWLKILKRDKNHFDELIPDGLHPSVEGSRLVITPSILKALL